MMSKSDVAEYLSVSTRTVDLWVKQGLLPEPTMSHSSRTKRWDMVILNKHLDLSSERTKTGTKSVAELLHAHTQTNTRGDC